jgi:hypothetical protein
MTAADDDDLGVIPSISRSGRDFFHLSEEFTPRWHRPIEPGPCITMLAAV